MASSSQVSVAVVVSSSNLWLMLHHDSVGAAGATLLAALLGRTGWGLRALGYWCIVSEILIVISVSVFTVDF